MLSPEGIPWKNYRLGQLALMAPATLPIGWYVQLVWKLSRRNAVMVGAERIPSNAILYDFHIDVATNFMTMHLLREAGKKVIYSGYHGFASYSAFGPGSMGAYDVWRYDRRLPQKPFDQFVDELKAKPNRVFGIFTDAGGPYYQVRESLARLALASNRPLVPYRSLYKPVLFKFANQNMPAPFVRGKSLFGQAIHPPELEAVAPENRASFLESKLRAVSDEYFPKAR